MLLFASLVGPESAVRAITAAANLGKVLTFESVRDMSGWTGPNERIHMRTEKGAYRSIVRMMDTSQHGVAHAVLLHESLTEPTHPEPGFLTLGEDGGVLPVVEAFWRFWQRRWPIPGLREWAEWVWEEVRTHAEACAVYHPATREIRAYRVPISEEDLQAIITRGLRSGALRIPDGTDLEGQTLEGLGSVSSYLTRFSSALGRRIAERFTPLVRPGETQRDPLLDRLLRPLYPAQEDYVQGVVAALRQYGVGAVGVGEMGTGKTAMGAAVPYLLHGGRPYRWIVMCPPHLVDKWVREIQAVVPGADARVVDTVGDLERVVREWGPKPDRPQYLVLSRERAKLDSPRRPGVLYGHVLRPGMVPVRAGPVGKRDLVYTAVCPRCGRGQIDKEGAPVDLAFFGTPRAENRRCVHCREILWSVGRPGPLAGRWWRRPDGKWDGPVLRRVALAEYIKRRLKHWAHGLIVDEFHELKGDTAQGHAYGALAASVRYVVALTGTLTGGYAHDVFRLLYRMRPEAMRARGFEWGSITRFARTYGRIEIVRKRSEDDAELNASSKGAKTHSYMRVRPGISPLLFGQLLLPYTAFIELADLGADVLPEYREEVSLVPMEPDLEVAYAKLEGKLKEAVAKALHGGSKRLLGAYLQALLNYPDRPWGNPAIVDPASGEVIAVPEELPRRLDRAKVQELARICLEEHREGRRVLVYATATDTRDVQPWIREVLQAAGLRVAVMYGREVPPRDRDGWITEQVRRGVDVLVTNPRLVETGLDLLEFPSIVWFQTGYSLFTLRQASRRSWRIGQDQPVRVRFLAYAGTIQERALQLMGSKLEAAMSLEGRFSEEGLRALADTEDVTTALAKALVHGLDGTGSAESIWRRIGTIPGREKAVGAGPVGIGARTEPRIITVDAGAFFGRRRRSQDGVKQLAFVL